ncbi:MAG: hypothetical protein JO097_15665 [Acidobacteriaceae bacterium]|nr:hypothetical protein [Acidobacteriaceae bacterium]MBV9764785.1 hypothetical protein [Acidobacteriaceae bacterium]
MKFTSRLHNDVSYSSVSWQESSAVQGARFAIRKVSLSQRIELTKSVRELALRHEFLKAGDVADQLEATLADLLVKRLYLEWGLAEVRGFTIDGQPATVELLIEKGPEGLTDEIMSSIRAEIGLSEEQRKNS